MAGIPTTALSPQTPAQSATNPGQRALSICERGSTVSNSSVTVAKEKAALRRLFLLRIIRLGFVHLQLGSDGKDHAAIAVRISPRKGRSVKISGRIHGDPSVRTRARSAIEHVDPAENEIAVGPAGELENCPTAIAVVAGLQPTRSRRAIHISVAVESQSAGRLTSLRPVNPVEGVLHTEIPIP